MSDYINKLDLDKKLKDCLFVPDCKPRAMKLCGLCKTCLKRSLFNFPCHLELDEDIDPKFIFKSSSKKLKWKCIKNHKWITTVYLRTSGSKCPDCSKINRKICSDIERSLFKYEIIREELKDKTLDPKTIYAGSNDFYDWICNVCQHEWNQKVGHRTSGHGCPECNRVRLMTCDDVKKSLFAHEYHKQLKDKTLDPKTIYASSGQKFEWVCEKCNFEWSATPCDRTRGTGCPSCKNKTFQIFYEFLKSLDVGVIIVEKTFEWCKNIRLLPFDFYLPKYNLLIECDGDQHFKDIEYFESEVEDRVYRDCKKMIDALNHNLSIIRISQIDVYNNRFDWKTKLTKCIRAYEEPTVKYLSKDKTLYDYHIQRLGELYE